MHTVVETASYLADAARLFSEAERAAIVTMLAADPFCGEVMQGTGGVRKVRIGRGNKGKSGGARVIYIVQNEHHPLYVLAVFAKNEKDNLTKAERNALASSVKALFSSRSQS